MNKQLPANPTLNFKLDIPLGDIVSLQQSQLFPEKENDKKQILSILYHQWKTWTIAVKMDLKEFHGDLSAFQGNKKHLRVKFRREWPKIELGDRVRIKMKHRQIKQITKAGWNDLMKVDIDEIAIVIAILAPNGAEVVISFPRSGLRWAINTHALEVVNEEQQLPTNSSTDLKIGDSVMIRVNVPEYVITIMQSLVSLPALEVIKSFPACYSIGRQYLVKNNIDDMVKLPFWTYRHSKILGMVGIICYQGRDGMLGITVEGEGFLITIDYLRREWRTNTGRQRRRTGEREPYKLSSKYPFYVDAAVQFKIGDDERCERLLADLKIPQSFLKVVREECATFLGYDALGRAHIEFQRPINQKVLCTSFSVSTPIQNLKHASEAMETAHHEMLERFRSIKVDDMVSLNGARYSDFICLELDLIHATDEIKHAMTSNATLMAFDDKDDRAILKYESGKMFSCSSSYVSVACPDRASTASVGISSPSTSSSRILSDDDDDFEALMSRKGLSDKNGHSECVNDVDLNGVADVNEEDEQDETVPKLPSVVLQETHHDDGSPDAAEERPFTTSYIGFGPPNTSPGPSGDIPEPTDIPCEPSDVPPESYETTSQHRSNLEGTVLLETHPTMHVNPTTRDFVVVGNLGRHARLCTGLESLQSGLRRQNSTTSAPTDDSSAFPVIGGTYNNTFQMNQCTIGTINTGASAATGPSN